MNPYLEAIFAYLQCDWLIKEQKFVEDMRPLLLMSTKLFKSLWKGNENSCIYD